MSVQHTKTGWAFIAIGVAAFVTLLRVTSAEQPSSERAEATGEIPAHVYAPYEAVDYEQTYAFYGERIVLGAVQQLRERGAEAAMRDARCDQVISSDLSMHRSTAETIVVFTDCENGYRLYSEQSVE